MNFRHLFLLVSLSIIFQCNVSAQAGHIDDTAQQSVIDFDVERDLELFHSMNSSHKGVLAQFDHTFTSFGKQRLYQQFGFISLERYEPNQCVRDKGRGPLPGDHLLDL